MSEVIQTKKWTKAELQQMGFKEYPRKKEIIMARRLPAAEAPLEIKTDQGDILVAQADYMICYQVGETVQPDISAYQHWPVEPTIFASNYHDWDEQFEPTAVMQHLMAHGCKPYYKITGVWAKDLDTAVYIQSLEHEKPVLVQEGRYLAIGTEGEPYHMSDQSFHNRYDSRLTETPFKRVLKKLIGFFRRED
jgi:hypothetical protein